MRRLSRLEPGTRIHAAAWAWVLVVVAAVVCVLLLVRPQPLPAPIAGTPLPRLVAIDSLRLDAGGAHPRLRAARASPVDDGPFTFGGSVRGLALEDVAIELRPGVELRARRGRLDAARLLLGPDVRVERAGRRLLVAAEVEVDAGGGRLRFPGIVVLDPDGVPDARRDVELTAQEILDG